MSKTKFDTMKPKVKKAWVAALRSGRYKKGKCALRTVSNNGEKQTFCCLGVLCDLGKNSKKMWKPSRTHGDGEFYYGDSGPTGMLPTNVTKKSGVSKAAQQRLVNMNDNDSASFSKIADWIDKNL